MFHAINYLLGRLDELDLTDQRAVGGLQPRPSRATNPDPVDFSTGSVGCYRGLPRHARRPNTGMWPDILVCRRVAGRLPFVGDAELDEGRVGKHSSTGWCRAGVRYCGSAI